MYDEEEPEVLENVEAGFIEPVDHPAEVTEEEALQGHAVYLEVDDLDDDSDGIDEGGQE